MWVRMLTYIYKYRHRRYTQLCVCASERLCCVLRSIFFLCVRFTRTHIRPHTRTKLVFKTRYIASWILVHDSRCKQPSQKANSFYKLHCCCWCFVFKIHGTGFSLFLFLEKMAGDGSKQREKLCQCKHMRRIELVENNHQERHVEWMVEGHTGTGNKVN